MGMMSELFIDVINQEQELEDTDWNIVQDMIESYKWEEELNIINKQLEEQKGQ